MENGLVRLERAEAARFRRVARERCKEGLARLFLRQAWAEFSVSVGGRLHFRETENARAVRAYCAMTVPEFEGINARQKWANWRSIPRNLHGRLPRRPCRAVDLCSGVGDSTEVLACYLPEGSEILGLEYNPEFVRKARSRIYRDAQGAPVKAEFRVQSVLEAFRDCSGKRLPDASVDLVNCCGALAVNFDESAIGSLAAEIFRVLQPEGLATVDAPANCSGKERMIRIFSRCRFDALGSAQSCFLDRFSQICFRRGGP
ncbi:MAG: class I SAM-dependent methyltransferase [Elusimicrobia bacterium]|nr:class I SAM-dependent methyltransferase [Elusimicrobiota bacterium]